MEGTAYALEDFAVGELVLVRNVNRKEPWWPAIVLDPIKEAPETVRRQMQPERLCVMFYGPPANKKRPRDFCWAKEGDVLPLIEHLEQLQSLYAGRKDRGSVAFQAAIEEVLLVERGFKDPLQGASEDSLEGGQQASDVPGCSSCGIPLNQIELDNTEQYEGRCGNCQKLYDEKNYCPVCNKVWLPTDKNMVECDGCSFWVHSHCDPLAAKALKGSSEETYHCPTCREKTSSKSRLAALKKAEDEVRKAQPKKPRTAYNLFSVEIHKQYSVDNGLRIDFKDMARVVGETWRTLTAREKAPYEADARKESAQYEQDRKKYEEKHKVWADLHHKAKASGLIKEESKPMPPPSTLPKPAAPEATGGHDDQGGTSPKPPAKPVTADTAQRIVVMCNGYRGTFLLGLQRVICMCTDCRKKPEAEREFSCTQYEQHCGAGAAKKWKASLRIEPGSVPEVPEGSHPMQVGKWLDQQGIDVKPSARPCAAPAALPIVPTQKATEKLLAAVYAPWNDMDNGRYKPVKVRWAGDRCTVCDSDVDYDQDQLVSCDMCGITVHQSCYGVQELPGEDDMWLCRACELKDDSKPPQCCLCPIEGGALKPTTEPGLWCHATCLQWIPEVSVGDDRRMEPVTHIRSIQKERWELNCCICKQRVGAKIQCSSCYTAYHPLCARIAGLYMNMVDASEGQEDGAVRLISYCPKHCTPHPELAGIQVVKKGEDEGEESEDDTNGLWNGQPFRPLPTVTLPDLLAGCARAMSLQGWERGSHGTGMGHTTNKGFWIPEKPVAPPQEEFLALPEPSKGRNGGGRPLKKHKAPSAPRVPKAGPGRQPKEIKQETDQESQDEEPPTAVELVALPEGVPEVLHVTCNGRSGRLLVRTQRVQHGDSEISASKFEQVCGKGDAKKWKCSIWIEGEDGSQVMMMQDWLAVHKLDRKQLAALAGNAQAAQVYEDYLHQTVQEVVHDLLAEFDEPQPAEDMSVKDEDKPEQDVAKLDVAEAAPIKHEHHAADNTHLLRHDQQQQQQQQQADTAQVRMAAAADAESDPLQNGHPEDLEARSELLEPMDSDSAAIEAAFSLAQSGYFSQLPEHQSAAGAPVSLHNIPAWAPASDRLAGPVAKGNLHKADPITKGNAPMGHGLTEGTSRQQQLQSDTSMANPRTAGLVAASMIKDEDMHQEPGPGFQTDDSPMGVEVDVMDPENAYVKVEKEPLMRHASGSSGSEGGQAAMLDLGMQHRQASPAAHAGPSDLEVMPRRKRSRSQDGTPVHNGDLKRQKSASVPRPDAETGIEMPRDRPEAWVGQKCKVFWPDDSEWYDAVVRAYDRSNGKHNVWYAYDQQGEWIDLAAEIDAQRICWMTYLPGSKPKAIEPKAEPCEASQPALCTDIVLAETADQSSDEQQAVPQGKAAVGQQVAIWWPDDHAWYHGRVQGFQAAKGEHLIHYEDNEVEWLNLAKERVLWKDLPGRPVTPFGEAAAADAMATAAAPPETGAEDGMLALAAAAPTAAEPAAPAVPRGPVPDTVPIVCNSSRAVFDVKRTCILLGEGRECTPTEFERLAGKGASKKWKASLRVDKGGGIPGPTMGDWLVDAGLDAAKAARPKAAPALHAARRQQVSRQRFGTQAPKPQGKQAHRDGCMCIICKQARRVGKTWGGMSGMPDGPKWQAAMLTGGRQGQPVPRFGKRAFLHALPHLVCGPLQHKVWKLPDSKAWAPDDWLLAKGHKVEEAAPTPAVAPTPPVKPEGTTRRGSLIRHSSVSTSAAAATAAAAVTADKDANQAKAAGKAAGAKAVGERKGLTMKERLQKCQQTERQRITFGKSGIHGWGLIARSEMKQDSMVVEYRGDLLRPNMSDDRQKLYNRIGKDCYLFNVNDDVVIDATMSGAVGRFTNHCCAPSMYTKVLEVEGESRLVFFARTDIKPGQELTYDYRFKEEEGDDKLQCKCGAPNCRGTLN